MYVYEQKAKHHSEMKAAGELQVISTTGIDSWTAGDSAGSKGPILTAGEYITADMQIIIYIYI